MISEEQQDQAALYALGLLGADEDPAFESELRANAELRDLVRELREAAGDLALTAPSLRPPASLKQRIMGEIVMKTKRVVPMPTQRTPFGWIPWAIAAALGVFCGLLAFDHVRVGRPHCRQSGVIRISNLPAPQPGKDYQLWAVDAGHKDPISAGIVRVDKNGVAQVRFKPVEKAEHVKAFAISLEREGGVPKKEGPILLVGTT